MPPAHAPSRARALVAAAKSGQDVRSLAAEARRLDDPYHAAWALFHLSRNEPSLRPDALALLEKVPQAWRRGELAADVVKSVRDDSQIATRLARVVADMPASEARADAMRTIVKAVEPELLPGLLERVLTDNANAVEDGKTILRVWSTAPSGTIEPALTRAPPAVRARLFGYLHLQGAGAGQPLVPDALGRALAAALSAPDRTEILRYLTTVAQNTKELDQLLAAKLDAAEHGRMLAASIARADRLGAAEHARTYVAQAGPVTERIPDPNDRSRIRNNLAQAAERLGMHAEAQQLRAQADEERPTPPRERGAEQHTVVVTPRAPGHRPVLALHNGYDGALGPPHLRAAARAAPLCVAFGLDLLLIGFPAPDIQSFVKRCESETRVGDGTEYLRTLYDHHRISWVARQHHAHPHAWNIPGAIVATTPNPDPAKIAQLRDLPAAPVLVMGLGPEGLPESILREAPHHLELTGHGVPLETATAMGVLAERLRAFFSHG